MYVAYGVGDNLDLWSGPHVMTLKNVDISHAGSKRFTLTLVPQIRTLDFTGRRGLYTEGATLDLEGLTYEVEANSENLDFYNVFTGSQDPIYQSPLLKASEYAAEAQAARKGQEDALSDAVAEGYKYAAAVLEKIDIHILVTDIIKDYIRKCLGNSNVIVLIPDLNKLCLESIDEIAKTEGRAGALLLQEPADAPQGPYVEPISWESNYLDTDKKYLALYNTLLSILNSLGLELNSQAKDNADSFSIQNPPYSMPSYETEQFQTYEERLESFLKDNYIWASLRQTETKYGFPDHTKTLMDLINSIYKLAKGKKYSKFVPISLYESDSKVVDLWAESRAENGLFAGAGRQISDKRAVFIFGDRQLIKDYLYGEYNGEGQSPLHPVDRASLGGSYKNKIRNILKKKSSNVGPFGDIYYLPDNFAYLDETFSNKNELQTKLQEAGVPVFRYNTQNPNVLSLSYKQNGAYLTELVLAYTKEIQKRGTANFEGILDSKYSVFDLPSPEAVIAFIRSKHNMLGHNEKAKNEIISELSSRFDSLATESGLDPMDEAKMAYSLYSLLLARPDNPMIKIDSLLPGDPVTSIVDFAEQLYKQTFTVEITSLPMFHLSYANTIGKTALLLAQDVPVKQSRTPQQTLLNQYYSGLYTIQGFKHIISNGKAQTQLTLVKQRINASNTNAVNSGDFEL